MDDIVRQELCYNDDMVHTLTVHPVPEVGRFEIMPHVVEVTISAKEAEKICCVWLMDNINMAFLGDTPEFVINEGGTAVWRVPVLRCATHVGVVGQVGHADVDAKTGDMLVSDEEIKMWYVRGDELQDKIPPYKSGTRPLPPEMIPPPHLRAPVVEPME